jgi:hypothetical protein
MSLRSAGSIFTHLRQRILQPKKKRRQFRRWHPLKEKKIGTTPAGPSTAIDTAPARMKPEKATAQSAQADNGIQLEFIVLGGILLLGFVLIMVGFLVLFKRMAARPAADDEIADVLEEVQALKSEATHPERLSPDIDDGLEDDDPDFGEPRERLSVSLVSPFLDYEDARSMVQPRPTDEIAVKPAFSDEAADGANLSVSNMETLIGTASPMVDDK